MVTTRFLKKIILSTLLVLLFIILSSCALPVSEGPQTAATTPSLTPLPVSSPSPTPSLAPPSPSPEPTKPDTAVIIFTFDDGPESDYLLAYPILKEYGIKGTSYIVTSFTDESLTGKLTWDQIKEMSAYGWAFGDHTVEHRRLTEMSDDEIKESMEAVNRSFTDQGFALPAIMAYPYGAYDQRVIAGIAPYRAQARLAEYEKKFVDLDTVSSYAIDSISADMRKNSQLEKVEKLVDKACEENAVIVFRVHTLYREEPYDTVPINKKILSGCAPQTDSKLFEQLVKYCVDKGCAFMTMVQFMDLCPQG
jgi:peptidoglycan/xylan/chitin deacetylase (PgdA/CDA1 family)